jgi:hypothetical protein
MRAYNMVIKGPSHQISFVLKWYGLNILVRTCDAELLIFSNFPILLGIVSRD